MIEKELKVLLTKGQYDLLIQQFDWDEIRTQTNFYYTNCENHIKNEDITIRVRECNNKVALQVKVPLNEQGALHISKEFETYIKDVPKDIDGTFLSKLCSIPMSNVSMAGFLITERYICNWKDDIEICLDKNKYLNVEDYEIEIEYKENIDSVILDILNMNNINTQNKVEGKCKRFFDQLNRISI